MCVGTIEANNELKYGVKIMTKLLFTLLMLLMGSNAHAWDGFDWGSGSFVEVQKGELVREGETIEIYEYGEGYKEVDVESISRYGSSVELDVYDHDTGEYRTFDMDD